MTTLRYYIVGCFTLMHAFNAYGMYDTQFNTLQRTYQTLKANPRTSAQALTNQLNTIENAIDSTIGMNSVWKNQKHNWVYDERGWIQNNLSTQSTTRTPSGSSAVSGSSSSSSAAGSIGSPSARAGGSSSASVGGRIGGGAGTAGAGAVAGAGIGGGVGGGAGATAGSGTGIGGSGTGMGSGSGTGAQFGSGTAAGGSAPISEEIPEAPPLNPSFSQPAAPVKPKPAAAKPNGALNPLTAAELAALSPAQKNASDALFISIIATLADIKDDAIKAIGGDTQYFEKLTKNGLAGNKEIYLTFITTALEQLNKQAAFKKRGELSALIQSDGSFVKFMKKTSSDPDSLQRSYDDLEGANRSTKQLTNLFTSCLFDPTPLQLQSVLIENLFINILVSMRPLPGDVKPVAAGKSDRLVLDTFRAIFNAPAVKAAINAREAFEKANPRQAAAPTILDKDYVNQLYVRLNRLRVHPLFLKFNRIFDPMMRKQASSKKGIEQFAVTPLLDLLISNDQKTFAPKNLSITIKAQTLFNPDDFNEVVPAGSPALRIILEDHIERMIKQQGTIDICAFLQEKMETVKDAKGLQAVLATLKSKVQSQQDVVKQIADTSTAVFFIRSAGKNYQCCPSCPCGK